MRFVVTFLFIVLGGLTGSEYLIACSFPERPSPIFLRSPLWMRSTCWPLLSRSINIAGVDMFRARKRAEFEASIRVAEFIAPALSQRSSGNSTSFLRCFGISDVLLTSKQFTRFSFATGGCIWLRRVQRTSFVSMWTANLLVGLVSWI